MKDKIKAIPIMSALWLVHFMFRWLSVDTAWKLGECLGSLCYFVMSDRKATITKNIEIVSKHTGAFQVTDDLIKAIFQRNCANLTCSLKTYGMTPEQLSEHITLEVCDEFTDAVRAQSGAILCLAHMGNWELLSKIMPLMDPTPEHFGAVYRPLDNKVADAYVAEQRSMYGCQMFSKKLGVTYLSSFVRDGGVLGILADQRSGKSHKNNRPFFGVDSARSKLPAVLHLRTEAPIFNLAVSSSRDAHWRIQITPLQLTDKTNDRESVLDTVTKGYEKSFAEHLLDVFWMHRYWRV